MSQTASMKVPWKDIERFMPRIGVNPLERLQWALSFGQKDLELLTSGDRDNLRLELTAFAEKQLRNLRFGRWQLPKSIADASVEDFGDREIPTDKELLDIHAKFHQILSELYTIGLVIIPVEQQYLAIRLTELIRSLPPGYKAEAALRRKDKATAFTITDLPPNLRLPPKHTLSVELSLKGDLHVRALHNLAELLSTFGDLLEICPDEKCGRWFVRGRRNQVYCSPQCQTRVNTRNFRKRLAEQQRAPRRKRRTPKGG